MLSYQESDVRIFGIFPAIREEATKTISAGSLSEGHALERIISNMSDIPSWEQIRPKLTQEKPKRILKHSRNEPPNTRQPAITTNNESKEVQKWVRKRIERLRSK